MGPVGAICSRRARTTTAKIWSMGNSRCSRDLKLHTKEIYTIKWSHRERLEESNLDLVLASASFDSTVEYGIRSPAAVNRSSISTRESPHICAFPFVSLSLPRSPTLPFLLPSLSCSDPVYSVAFSPNGQFLASGSFDKCLHIWNVKDGSLVKTYRGQEDI